MNLSRFRLPSVLRRLWASGAMSSTDENFDRFMAAKARMELDPDLRHECNGRHEGTVDDHYPLNRSQIKLLLTVALAANNIADKRMAMQTKARVGIRLVQAIKGHKCPHEIEGFASDVQTVLEHFYVQGVREDFPLDTFIALITSILSNEQPNVGVVSETAWRRFDLVNGEEVQFVKVEFFGTTYAAAINYTNNNRYSRPLNLSKALSIGEKGIIEKKAA